jgi:hypothetical protein
MFTVEAALLLSMFAVWGLRRSWRNLPKVNILSLQLPAVAFLLVSALSFSLVGMILFVDRMPHGDWDGWNIWNSHARLLHRAGDSWKSMLPYTFHGDYPLLTSAIAARYWRYAGGEVPDAGALLGILLSLSAVAVLVLTLVELRDIVVAVLFGLVLLGTPAYLELASDQFADVPLSFFILTTIALIVIHLERRPADSGLLVLAGFAAGCAAWTKNEGLLFLLAAFVVLSVSLVLSRPEAGHQVGSFVAGALPAFLVILAFKFTVASQNDLIGNSTYSSLAQVLNWQRHITVLRFAGRTLWSFGAWWISPIVPLFVFVGLRGGDRVIVKSSSWLTGFGILAIVAAGYYCVYVTTPLDLQYHLTSSLDRLILQIWPSFLLLLGLAARSLRDERVPIA